jgi:hypothetical protein
VAAAAAICVSAGPVDLASTCHADGCFASNTCSCSS